MIKIQFGNNIAKEKRDKLELSFKEFAHNQLNKINTLCWLIVL